MHMMSEGGGVYLTAWVHLYHGFYLNWVVVVFSLWIISGSFDAFWGLWIGSLLYTIHMEYKHAFWIEY